jgi:cytosine/adenosine deaminase-related metal-dependent hydrolase
MDPAIGDCVGCDVLVRDGRIAAVGPRIPASKDVLRIDASGMIALPGLIDAHNCLWQTVLRGRIPDLWPGTYFSELLPMRSKFTAEDNWVATHLGAHEALSYGTTTVVDYCHNVRGPGFADASIEALRSAGIRHAFTYSFLSERPDLFAAEDDRLADAEDVFQRFDGQHDLTHVHFGIDSVGTGGLERQLGLARSLRARSCIHVNATNDVQFLHERRLLGSDLLAIHGNLITDRELEWMAQANMPICFTPSADVQGVPADVVRRATERGVDIVYGCDVPSHVASDMLMQLRIMFYVQGYIDGAMARSFNVVNTRRPPVRPGMPLLRPRDLITAATTTAARILGLQDAVGSLTPGKSADILLVRKGDFGSSVSDDPYAHILLQTSARDIEMVMVAGRIRVRDGKPLNFDTERASELLQGSRSRLLG